MQATEDSQLLPGAPPPPPKPSFLSFLRAFWPLAFVSFGGPPAHVALLHDRFVAPPPARDAPRVAEPVFLELWALAQSLPGPGSTQLVTSLGATFGGLPGATITFLVWHLPGFALMTAAGLWFHAHAARAGAAVVVAAVADRAVGLIAAAFAFVLVAAFKIVDASCRADRVKMAIALVSMFVAVIVPPAASAWVFVLLLAGGGAAYLAATAVRARAGDAPPALADAWDARVSAAAGATLLATVGFATAAIAVLPSDDATWRLLKIFWRIGLCVFGGGIVVVPMLINELVESGMLPTSVFLAGFGLFGCVPGPMFNLAPFLGAALLGVRGAFVGSLGIFGPGLLLQVGLLPFWARVRTVSVVRVVLQGTNAAAAGLIVAGVWMLLRKALVGPAAFALTCSAGAMSLVFGLAPVQIIVSHGLLGVLLVSLGIGGPYHLVETVGQ